MRYLKERFRKFLKGRNGLDELGILLMSLSFGLFVLSGVLRSLLVLCAAVILLIWSGFREFSRDIESRKLENQRYLGVLEHHRFKKQSKKVRRQFKKSCSYRKCPGCKKEIRVLLDRKERTVICPHCSKKLHADKDGILKLYEKEEEKL